MVAEILVETYFVDSDRDRAKTAMEQRKSLTVWGVRGRADECLLPHCVINDSDHPQTAADSSLPDVSEAFSSLANSADKWALCGARALSQAPSLAQTQGSKVGQGSSYTAPFAPSGIGRVWTPRFHVKKRHEGFKTCLDLYLLTLISCQNTLISPNNSEACAKNVTTTKR